MYYACAYNCEVSWLFSLARRARLTAEDLIRRVDLLTENFDSMSQVSELQVAGRKIIKTAPTKMASSKIFSIWRFYPK